MAHYEAYLGSTLIVEDLLVPYNSWNDVAKSDLRILAWHGSLSDSYFKHPSNNILQEIYRTKIVNEKSLGDVGFEKSIEMVESGQYGSFESLGAYRNFEEYPCEITDIKAPEMR